MYSLSVYNRASSYTRPSTAAVNQTNFMKSIEFLRGMKSENPEEDQANQSIPDFKAPKGLSMLSRSVNDGYRLQ
jgi:hypothetical protein